MKREKNKVSTTASAKTLLIAQHSVLLPRKLMTPAGRELCIKALYQSCCGETGISPQWLHRQLESDSLEAQQTLVPRIGQFYENAGEGVQRDEAMRCCGIVAQTLMLAAKAMGYGIRSWIFPWERGASIRLIGFSSQPCA